MFDTHCHLNFKSFKNNLEEVITEAYVAGVNQMVIPGTDFESSKRAVEIASQYDGIYAAVGVHPHHVFGIKHEAWNTEHINHEINKIQSLLDAQCSMLNAPYSIVAIGEVGLDKHIYQQTKYENYHTNDEFISLQKEFLIAQLQLAIKYKQSIILHNREAVEDILNLITDNWSDWFSGHMVFHCCEADERLLEFAIKHNIYIGVDGDVTFSKSKQEFIRKVPLELLVLETDSPFLLPEPLRSQKLYPNKPSNLPIIVEIVAKLLKIDMEEITDITSSNAINLFLNR